MLAESRSANTPWALHLLHRKIFFLMGRRLRSAMVPVWQIAGTERPVILQFGDLRQLHRIRILHPARDMDGGGHKDVTYGKGGFRAALIFARGLRLSSAA
jgi:hypothetical protein